MLKGHTCNRENLAAMKPPAAALQQGATQKTRLSVNVHEPFGTGIALNAFHQCRAMTLA